MNNSSSPGFLYYDTTGDSSGTNESSDYIECNNSRSPQRGFSPGQYGGSRGQARGQRGWRGRRPFQGVSGRGRYSHSPQNRETNNSSYKKHYNKGDRQNDGDMSAYVNRSMLEDPWAELTKALHERVSAAS